MAYHAPTSLSDAHALYAAAQAALDTDTLEAPETALLLAQACLEWATPETALALWVQAQLILIEAHLTQDLGDLEHHEHRAWQQVHVVYLVLAGLDPVLALHPC